MSSLKRFIKSFTYAFSGLCFCIRSCRNFRFHIVVMLYVLYFSRHFDFNAATYAVLFVLFALVLCAETFNTALEQACNSITEKPLESIGRAKDAAAASVLIAAVFSLAVAAVLFFKDFKLFFVLAEYITDPLKLSALVISLVVSFIFVFCEGIYKNGKQ